MPTSRIEREDRFGATTKKNDPVLYRLVKETAEELGIKPETVWRVFRHHYTFIFKLMTGDSMIMLTPEKRNEVAKNVVLPGFGRLVNKYGKSRAEAFKYDKNGRLKDKFKEKSEDKNNTDEG